MIIVTSPALEASANQDILIEYSNGLVIDTNNFFSYRQNPNITDIFPLQGLLRYVLFVSVTYLS